MDTDRVRRDLLAVGALVVVAAVTAAAGAPGWASAPLTGVATALTVERVVRRLDRPALDALVRGAGGLVLALIAIGFLVNQAPHGLTRTSWSVAAAAVALLALASRARRPATPLPSLPAPRRGVVGPVAYVGAAALLAVAFTVTVRATDHAERPPLALSVESSDSVSAELAITGGTAAGTYDLRIDDGIAPTLVQGPIFVPAGVSVDHEVAVPSGSRITISLVAAGSRQSLRSLVLQGPGPLRAPAATSSPAAPNTPAQTTTPPSTQPSTTPPPTSTPPVVSPSPTPVLGPAAPLSTAPVGAPGSG